MKPVRILEKTEYSLPSPSRGGGMNGPAGTETAQSRPVRSTRGNLPSKYNDYDLSTMLAKAHSPDEPQ